MAVFVVPDDTAEQTVVAGGDPVVVVDFQGGECGDVDFEYVVGVDGPCELRVQSVDSLDEEHVVAVKAQRAVALYASSEIERVGREVYLLSGEKSTEVGVEQFEVKGVEAFVVVVAGLVEGVCSRSTK